jgi:hypothetical protein
MKIRWPRLYCWDGGRIIPDAWSFGYLTGPDNDLICVKPNLLVNIKAEIYLSPVCSTGLLAISAFLIKRILLKIDQNQRVSVKEWLCGSPNRESGNQWMSLGGSR